MTYVQNVKLPQSIRDAIRPSEAVPNTSKHVVSVMNQYKDSKEATLALLIRHLCRVKDKPLPDEPILKTTVTAPRDTCQSFADMAKQFGYSFDSLLRVALLDSIISDSELSKRMEAALG